MKISFNPQCPLNLKIRDVKSQVPRPVNQMPVRNHIRIYFKNVNMALNKINPLKFIKPFKKTEKQEKILNWPIEIVKITYGESAFMN